MTQSVSPANAASQENLPGLTWGLKRSFIRYISMLPDGGHSISGGASLTRSSLFNFKPSAESTYDPLTGRGALKFTGEVRLTGHGNLLFVLIADPYVEFGDSQTTLSVADSRSWPDRSRRIRLATIQADTLLRSAHGVFGEARVFLTDDGLEVFNGQYGNGEELDPIVVSGSAAAAYGEKFASHRGQEPDGQNDRS